MMRDYEKIKKNNISFQTVRLKSFQNWSMKHSKIKEKKKNILEINDQSRRRAVNNQEMLYILVYFVIGQNYYFVEET